jgi:hypothetical protein
MQFLFKCQERELCNETMGHDHQDAAMIRGRTFAFALALISGLALGFLLRPVNLQADFIRGSGGGGGTPGSVTYIGYDTVAIDDSSSGTKNNTVTIPAGANTALIGISYYYYAQGNPSSLISNVSLDGNSADVVQAQLSADFVPSYNLLHVSVVQGFSSGDKTLSWDQGSVGEGTAVIVMFFSGVDGTTPVSDFDSYNAGGGSQTQTLSLTASTGDMLVAFATSDDNGSTYPDLNQNSQTQVVTDVGITDYARIGAAYKAEGDDDDVAADWDYGGLVGVVLNAE